MDFRNIRNKNYKSSHFKILAQGHQNRDFPSQNQIAPFIQNLWNKKHHFPWCKNSLGEDFWATKWVHKIPARQAVNGRFPGQRWIAEVRLSRIYRSFQIMSAPSRLLQWLLSLTSLRPRSTGFPKHFLPKGIGNLRASNWTSSDFLKTCEQLILCDAKNPPSAKPKAGKTNYEFAVHLISSYLQFAVKTS